ncbi:MAG: alpha/beta fold hydrolase [Bacillota bacterium]
MVAYTVFGVIAALLLIGAGYEWVARRREPSAPLEGRLADVGGYRLHLRLAGAGEPAVVVIAGAGDPSSSWGPVQAEVARFAQILTYDRAGLGRSDDGPPASPDRYVTELHALLGRAGLTGPFVLVGHSFGGLLARLYAARHPGQIAGMVLVDPAYEALFDSPQMERVLSVGGGVIRLLSATSAVGLPRLMGNWFAMAFPEQRALWPRLTPAERRAWAADIYRTWRGGLLRDFGAVRAVAQAVRAESDGPPLAHVELVVLSNGRIQGSAGVEWVRAHAELAAQSARSTHHVSDRNSHMMHWTQPELVVAAIRQVVDGVRQHS